MTNSAGTRKPMRQWIGSGLLGLACLFGVVESGAAPASDANVKPEEALGVEVVAVSLSAADFLIDLRYRVKSEERAQAMLDHQVHPVLVNETTGERFTVPSAPKLGTLRQTTRGKKQVLRVDRTYFMLFSNPQRRLKVGDRVTLQAGDSVVHHLVVQ